MKLPTIRKYGMNPRATGKHRRAAWALCCLASCGTAPLHAACGVDTVSVAFGAYDPISGLAADGVGSVVVSCEPAASYSIALSAGGGSYAARLLTAGAANLQYNLYSNPSHSMVWGDGSAGTVTVDGTGTGATHHVYGRIPGSQTAAVAGAYSDLVLVTVDF